MVLANPSVYFSHCLTRGFFLLGVVAANDARLGRGAGSGKWVYDRSLGGKKVRPIDRMWEGVTNLWEEMHLWGVKSVTNV